jgi:hypothetical protein
VPLSWNEIKTRAAAFVNDWKDKAPTAREEADAQSFQIEFFNIFGVDRKKVAIFEDKVKLYKDRQQGLFENTTATPSGYIDLLWKGHILIEMKSPGKDLEKAYEQAKNYARALDKKDFPKAATAPIRPALRTYISFIALQASSTVFRSRISNLRGSAC